MTAPRRVLVSTRLPELKSGNQAIDNWVAQHLQAYVAQVFEQMRVLAPAARNAFIGWTPRMEGVSRDGSTFAKTGGVDGAWDSAFYSQDGFNACSVSFRASQTDMHVMVGLNSDPTTNHSYTSIDYAIELLNDGTIDIYESAVQVIDNATSYTTDDQLRITYDGLRVRYYKNATLLRTTPLIGARLFLDSSFFNVGAAVNSVAFGPMTHVLAGAIAWAGDSQGKPAGIRGIGGLADRSQLSLVNGRMRITSTPDTTVGYGFPAIPINDAKTYQLTVRHLSSASSADGLYIVFHEYSSAALPAGITHVGDTAVPTEAVVVDGTSDKSMVNNGPMPGTTAAEQTFTYAPTAGAKFASLAFYNWDPATAGVHYEVEWVALTELGSDVDILPGVLPPVDTFQMNQESATQASAISEAGPVTISSVTGPSVDFVIYITFEVEEATDIIEVSATATWNNAFAAFGGSSEAAIGYLESPYSGSITPGQYQFWEGAGNVPLAISTQFSGLAPGAYRFGLVGRSIESGSGDATVFQEINLAVTRVKR